MHNEINIIEGKCGIRNEVENWILQYEPLFSHALTLTFNHTKVRRQMMEIDSTLCLSSPQMVDLYKANIRCFKWKLMKSLYGNSWKRFSLPIVFIPILEGLGRNEKPHYHCILGVTDERRSMVEEHTHAVWSDMPFGSGRVDVKPYSSRGWCRYITKNALFLDRDNVDWDNVLIPQ